METTSRATVKRGVEDPDPLDREPSEAELREFMKADDEAVKADPAFRERLRAQIWRLVRAKASR